MEKWIVVDMRYPESKPYSGPTVAIVTGQDADCALAQYAALNNEKTENLITHYDIYPDDFHISKFDTKKENQIIFT